VTAVPVQLLVLILVLVLVLLSRSTFSFSFYFYLLVLVGVATPPRARPGADAALHLAETSVDKLCAAMCAACQSVRWRIPAEAPTAHPMTPSDRRTVQ
jgi:hypothetical protein